MSIIKFERYIVSAYINKELIIDVTQVKNLLDHKWIIKINT